MLEPNVTSELQKTAPDQLLAYITFEIFVSVITFSSNLLVFITIYKFKSLQTSTYWLVANLAAADIGVAIFAIPCAIILRMGYTLTPVSGGSSYNAVPPGAINSNLCLAIVSFVVFFTQVSIFSLLTIAIDRFIAIYYSLRYRTIVTSIRVKACILATWILGGMIGFAPYSNWIIVQEESRNASSKLELKYCAFEEVTSMEYMVYFDFFGCVLLPLVIMFTLYFFIFRSAKQQLRKIYSDVLHLKSRSSSKSSLHSWYDRLHLKEKSFYSSTPSTPHLQSRYSLRRKIFKIKKKPKTDNFSKRDEMEQYDSMILRYQQGNDSLGGEEDTPASAPTSASASAPDSAPQSRRPSAFIPVVLLLPNVKYERENQITTSSKFSTETLEDISDGSSQKSSEYHPNDSNGNIMKTERKGSEVGSINTTISSYSIDPDILRGKTYRRRTSFLKKEFKAARSLFTVVGVFALCWLPLHTLNCITLFLPEVNYPRWLTDFAILLSHVNSVVNPFIYAFHLHDMKAAFRKILKQIRSSITTFLRIEKS